jgi:hypothetical protein
MRNVGRKTGNLIQMEKQCFQFLYFRGTLYDTFFIKKRVRVQKELRLRRVNAIPAAQNF